MSIHNETGPGHERGMAIDIAEGAYVVIALYRHNGKLDSACIAGRLEELGREHVQPAAYSLVESLRRKAEAEGAIPIQPLN